MKRFAVLLGACAMVGILAVPTVAVAQAETRDVWGLTDQDWLAKTGPELRAAIGMPAAASRVIAAAEKGDAKAAAILAGAYAVGSGVAKDEAESLRWAKVAADKKLPFGYFALALKYPPTDPQYKTNMELAAQGKHAAAMFNVALTLMETPWSDGKNSVGSDPLRAKELLEAASELGMPQATQLLTAWGYNDEFVEAGDGMPLWKDGRGLLSGHGELWAGHPCRTWVTGTKGGRWVIDWSQTQAHRGVKGELELWGVIGVSGLDQTSKVFGFFEFEGASRNLERSRANFATMKRSANDMNAICSTLGKPA